MQVKLKRRIGQMITLEVKGAGASSFTADQINVRLEALAGQTDEVAVKEITFLTHLKAVKFPT